MSVMYLIIFVFVKSASWGVNIDIKNTSSINYSPLAMPSFPATSGMLALSFFIHNIIITIMKSNADQKNNVRIHVNRFLSNYSMNFYDEK